MMEVWPRSDLGSRDCQRVSQHQCYYEAQNKMSLNKAMAELQWLRQAFGIAQTELAAERHSNKALEEALFSLQRDFMVSEVHVANLLQQKEELERSMQWLQFTAQAYQQAKKQYQAERRSKEAMEDKLASLRSAVKASKVASKVHADMVLQQNQELDRLRSECANVCTERDSLKTEALHLKTSLQQQEVYLKELENLANCEPSTPQSCSTKVGSMEMSPDSPWSPESLQEKRALDIQREGNAKAHGLQEEIRILKARIKELETNLQSSQKDEEVQRLSRNLSDAEEYIQKLEAYCDQLENQQASCGQGQSEEGKVDRLLSKIHSEVEEEMKLCGGSYQQCLHSLLQQEFCSGTRDDLRDAFLKDYQTLGLLETASPSQVRRAYRACALQHHPDKCVGEEFLFRQIQEAYQNLKLAGRA